MTLLLTLLLLQGPGDGWTFAPAEPREVKRLYWDLFQTTEVWVRLFPEGPQGEPPLVNLVFQAFFSGRAKPDPYSRLPGWPKGKPERLTLKIQGSPLTVIRELSARLVIDGDTVDLAGSGSPYRCLGCCGDPQCSPMGVEVDVEPSLLQSLIAARSVRGEGLGYPLELREADQLALGELAERIGLSRETTTK